MLTVSLIDHLPHDDYSRVDASIRRPELGRGVVERRPISATGIIDADVGDVIILGWDGGTYQSPVEKHQRSEGCCREVVVLADGSVERLSR